MRMCCGMRVMPGMSCLSCGTPFEDIVMMEMMSDDMGGPSVGFDPMDDQLVINEGGIGFEPGTGQVDIDVDGLDFPI